MVRLSDPRAGAPTGPPIDPRAGLGGFAEPLSDPVGSPLTTTISKIHTLLQSAVDDDTFPDIIAVHNHHCVADLVPRCISLDIDMFDETGTGLLSGLGILEEWDILVSVRVHTGYMGDPCIGSDNAELVDTITDFLLTHLNLGHNYRIRELSSGEVRSTFDDSKTVGAQFEVRVNVPLSYAQNTGE